MYISIGELAEIIGVSTSTLRRWEREEKIKPSYRTYGGHRRYLVREIKEALGLVCKELKRKVIAYARVSSHDQKEDLERQVERLKNYCSKNFKKREFEVIQDLGSGLNYKKRGLKRLLREILAGNVSEIILTHKDRLLRFGSELIFLICSAMGTQVRKIEEEVNLSDEQILARDVLEIITVFSARLYGKRAHQKK